MQTCKTYFPSRTKGAALLSADILNTRNFLVVTRTNCLLPPEPLTYPDSRDRAEEAPDVVYRRHCALQR